MGTPILAYVQEVDPGDQNLETRIGMTEGQTAEYIDLVTRGIYRTGNRPCMENFRGDIYVGGAFTRPLVRHATDRRWLPAGIKPPRDLLAVVPGASSGGSSGPCLAYITFLHKNGNRVLCESNPSNFVDVGTLTGEGRVWSNIQAEGVEDRVTHVRGYVSMNGKDYRMAWESPLGVTTVTENVLTNRLSLLGPNDFRHNLPPFGAKYLHPWAGRMWYANNPDFPYRVWYSKPGYPQYVGKQQFRDTLEREPVTGIWRTRSELIVFCLDNSYMIRQFGSGQDDFVMERLDSNVGTVSHHSIKEIHNRLWFMARDGAWIYDGAFRYVLDDLRPLYEYEYCWDPESFHKGFAVYDKLWKTYCFYRAPTLGVGESADEWEPKTGISPKTVIYTGYIGEFEPSMNGQELQPDWTMDFRGRQDSSAYYGKNNELYVGSCDGAIRRQIKPCELDGLIDDYRAAPGSFDPSSWGGDDDGDSVAKKVIIRHGHMLMNDPGDDKQHGKKIEQLWAYIESPVRPWVFYALGGDEEAWNHIRPDNVRHFWKYTWSPSDLVENRTIKEVVYQYEYAAQSVHFMIPELSGGRGFTFEVQVTSPVLLKYRGVGGMWSPASPAARKPTKETVVP